MLDIEREQDIERLRAVARLQKSQLEHLISMLARKCAELEKLKGGGGATEPHVIHQMEKAAPHKAFIGAPGADGNCNCNMCPYMALNTMEKLCIALRDLEPQIHVDEATRVAAKRSLDRMLEMTGGLSGLDVGRPVLK